MQENQIIMNKPKWQTKLGSGLITGAADDDPSGIATYSQAGAQFGYNMLWTLVLTLPLMIAIQLISARIGVVTGQGIAYNIKKHYSKSLLCGIVSLLFIANTLNISADIVAMGDALKLLIGGPRHLYAIIFGLVSLVLQVFIPYHKYVRFLKWLTLSLFSYVAVAFIIHIPWKMVAVRTVLPHMSMHAEFLMMVVAIFGTTISPYLFFWQASQEVEELSSNPGRMALNQDPQQANTQLNRIKIDTSVGMVFSNLIAFFIMLATAAVLNSHNITNIQTSAGAAEALRPLAGNYAFFLFALGIIGTGMLAIPVMAGSTAYAVAEAFKWREGMELKPLFAKGFYSIIILSTLIGMGLGFSTLSPIKALYWCAIVNGVIAVPIMTMMMFIASNTQIMGNLIVKDKLKLFGWVATLVMAIVVLAMFITMI